jgi:hypothetical protein
MAESGGLTAPEAFALIALPRLDIRKALKLGFLGLLAQGVLRSDEETRRGLIRNKRVVHLRVAPNLPANLPPIAASLVAVVRAAEPRDGQMSEIVKQARQAYGQGLIKFLLDYVGPALAARGLAELRRVRLLGFLPTSRFERTTAGDVEKVRIENAMHEAKAIPQYLDRDPAQAAALAVAAGGAILLVEELRPHYNQLARAFQERDSGSSTTFFDPGTSGGGSDSAGFDFGSIDFGSIDFGSIDFGSFDSFDSGFDAASDGGGGDGGSGSSGC